MKTLKKDSEEDYKQQFSKWDENLKKSKVESLEKLYSKIHDEIKKNPEKVKKEVKKVPQKFEDKAKTIVITGKGKYKIERPLTLADRKKRVEAKIKKALKGGK